MPDQSTIDLEQHARLIAERVATARLVHSKQVRKVRKRD